jgi:hypothetical protein
MTEIAIRQPAQVAVASNAVDLDSWVAVVQDVSRLADAICDTDFVPRAYRGNAPAAMAAILTGRELGLPPMTSLRHVQLVEGSASLSAEYKRARVLSAGHEFDVIEATNTTCTVSGRRRGSNKPPLVITYTIEDARRANLIKDRGGYQRRPRRMLFARAGTELCDFLFADVTNGLPTTELLAEDSDGVSGYDEQPAEAAKPTGRVTAAEIISSRQAAPQTASPAEPQSRAADAPSPPAPAAGEAPMPPLPGEEEPKLPPSEMIPVGPEHAAALDVPADDTDYDTPGTVTKAQVGKLQTVYHSQMAFTKAERDAMLTASEEIIRRGLLGPNDGRTHNNLSFNEAKTLIDTLERCGSRENLVALLAAGEMPGAGDE